MGIHTYVSSWFIGNFVLVVPVAPPTNMEVEALGPHSILVSWDPPPLLTQNGLILFYTLILTHNVSGQEEVYTSPNTSLILSSLSPYTWYQCTVTANTAIGAGPFFDPVTIQTPQDGTCRLSHCHLSLFMILHVPFLDSTQWTTIATYS